MIICADDYGLSADIDEAILELCGSGRLSAVSCMVLFQRCDNEALARLRQHESMIDVGLHFCLTEEGLPLSVPSPRPLGPFGPLFRMALMGRINSREVTSLLSMQYDLFVQKSGRTPDYIDGHLHVHQLPGIREGLLDFVASLPRDRRPYIRNTYLPLKEVLGRRLPFLKAVSIGAFGARMRRQLRAAGVPTNDGFAGIYDFRKWPIYGKYLPRFLGALNNPNGILVVHPGKREEWRRREFSLLRETSFAKGTPNRFNR
jgi:hypothetical protein